MYLYVTLFSFSWSQGFNDMIKEVHDLAGQHEVIAENTHAQVIKDAYSLTQELKQDRKKVTVFCTHNRHKFVFKISI